VVQGIRVEQGQFAGGMFDWLTPFSFTVGWALVWGYVLLGAGWLIIKTEGELLAWARRAAAVAALVVLLMMGAVSVWVPMLGVPAVARWGLSFPDVDWGRLLPLTPIPLLVAACFAGLLGALRRRATYAPYLWSVGLFLLGYAGLLVGIWPHLGPYTVTIWEGAAAPEAQAFLLAGTLVLLPLILGYHRLRLLDLPWQGQAGRRLPLKAQGRGSLAALRGRRPARQASVARGATTLRSAHRPSLARIGPTGRVRTGVTEDRAGGPCREN
jgi:cytochrome bd-type quinol oxidase subunit 2